MQRGFILMCLLLLPTLAWGVLPAGEQWREQLIGNFGGTDRRVGYGRNATGGAGGTLCTVSNLNDSGAGSLRACILTTGAQWIIFSVSGTINLTSRIQAIGPSGHNNKTIDGRGQNITISCPTACGTDALLLDAVNNWIIHNVTFTNINAFPLRLLAGAHDIWLDHVTMTGTITTNLTAFTFGSQGGQTGDASTDLTFSWSRFHSKGAGSGFILICSDPSFTECVNMRATLHHNWYQSTAEIRFPLMRHGKAHSFNNYLDNTNQYMDARVGSRFYSEHDIFHCDTYGGATGCNISGSGGSGGNLRVYCGGAGEGAATTCTVISPWLVTGTETYQQVSPGSYTPVTDYSYASFLETADATLRTKLQHTTTGAGRVDNPYNYLAAGTEAFVGWWKLDETSGTTAPESSASGVSAGTLTNMESPGDWVPGIIANSLQFDGTNEYVTIADSDLLSPVTTGEFSICAWVRMTAYPVSQAVLVGKGTASNYEYLLRIDSSGTATFVLWDLSGTDHSVAISGAVAPLNTWTHICGTYMSAVLTGIYVNGTLSGSSTTFTGTMGNGTSPVNLGRRPDDSFYLNGRLDDVRLFNYALTDAEIDAILAEGFDIVYHLDEVVSPANDAGQPGLYDGTWQNTPTPVAGQVNGALSFASASNEYVSVAISPSLSGTASVACWVKMTSPLTGTQTILSNADAAANTQVGLNINSDGSWNYLYTTGGVTRGFSSAAGLITAGTTWYHLATTDDGAGTVQLYQAGSPISTTPFGTPTAKAPTAPGPLTIGQRGASNVQYVNGAVDECHLVSRVMTAGEITALAAEAGGDIIPPAAPTNLRVVSP